MCVESACYTGDRWFSVNGGGSWGATNARVGAEVREADCWPSITETECIFDCGAISRIGRRDLESSCFGGFYKRNIWRSVFLFFIRVIEYGIRVTMIKSCILLLTIESPIPSPMRRDSLTVDIVNLQK